MNAPTGFFGDIAPGECQTRETSGHSPRRAILSTDSGEYTLHLMERPHILCTARPCVLRSWYEVRENGDAVAWYCLDHGILEMERLSADECRMVADAVRAMQAVAA